MIVLIISEWIWKDEELDMEIGVGEVDFEYWCIDEAYSLIDDYRWLKHSNKLNGSGRALGNGNGLGYGNGDAILEPTKNNGNGLGAGSWTDGRGFGCGTSEIDY
jgi:hypothetical protein